MDSYVIKMPVVSSPKPPVTIKATVAIKDSIDVAGIPTQLGSLACANNLPAKQDAALVKNLKQDGYAITGKTVMHELAFGMTGVNHAFSTPKNPLYPILIPGGSSSGSATVVAGNQADIAIGTDTGGSVRLPAACCGVYGFKPTFGLVSREGVWPPSTSLDCVGVFATRPELITQVMQTLSADFEMGDDRQQADSVCKLKVGWINTDAEQVITQEIQNALAKCSFIELVPQDLPNLEAAFRAGLTIINRETWLAAEPYYATGLLGKDVAERLEIASHTTDEQVAQAEKVRSIFSQEVDQALKNTRVLALPTLPHFPMTLEQALAGNTDVTISKLVRPFNLSGHPAIAIPCSSLSNLPISLQLVGRKHDDAYLCAITERIARSLQHKSL